MSFNRITLSNIVIFILGFFNFFAVAEVKNNTGDVDVYFEEIKTNNISMYRANFKKFNLILNNKEAFYILKGNSKESFNFKFINSNSLSQIKPEDKIAEKDQINNKKISLYKELQVKDLYPGIDITLSGNYDNLDFSFFVNKNGDLNNVQFEFSGTDNISLDNENNLILYVNDEEIKQLKPKIYKFTNGKYIEAKGNFIILKNNKIGIILQ